MIESFEIVLSLFSSFCICMCGGGGREMASTDALATCSSIFDEMNFQRNKLAAHLQTKT